MSSMLTKGHPFSMKLLRASRISPAARRHFDTTSILQQQSATLERASAADATLKQAIDLPGPPSLPILGNTLHMLLDKDFDKNRYHIFWKKLADTYGPICKLMFYPYPPSLLLTNPDDIEKVSRASMDNPVRHGLLSLQQIRKDEIDNYFEQKTGLLTENGEEWKRVRSRVQTPMMKPKNVASYLSKMDLIALEFMDKIAVLQKEHGEMPHNFQMELYKWALESVSLVAFNRRMGCLQPHLSGDSEPMTLIREVNNIFRNLNDTELNLPLWKLFPTKSYRKLRKSHAEFLRIVDLNIQQTEASLLARESDPDELTLMETLLLTPGLSRKDVVTLILDMVFAGIDTTSHTIGFTLYLLSKNKKCQVKLQEEIDTVVGRHNKEPLTSNQMGQLSYLKAVIKESLRIFPLTLGSARVLTSDLVLSGYLIPKGYFAMMGSMFTGHDEKYFPRAKEFIPERWLRHKPLGPIHPYAFLPFGVGTRMCIGRRIAEQEMYTFLVRAMQRYTVDYKYQDMDCTTRLVFVPSEPLRFNFTERN